MSRTRILNLSPAQLKEIMRSMSEPGFRSDQILKWVYQKSAASFEEMTDLPDTLREKLDTEVSLFNLEPVNQTISSDGDTRKVLFKLYDGKTIESSLMLYRKSGSRRERRTVCISTQVGCPVGCSFCATGQQGFERNLEPGEIIEQVLYFANLISAEKGDDGSLETPSRKDITNVVYMGMGEPLSNYSAVWQSVIMLNSKRGLNLGSRQITMSTAGMVPQIKRLARESIHIELAVSLHAAKDYLRDRLVPLNKRYPLKRLIPACREYLEKTGRRPTFEYALLKGVNDSPGHARELTALLEDFNCHVNLIAGNPTANQRFKAPPVKRMLQFLNVLNDNGLSATLRSSRGIDINAGCGQLRSRWLNVKPEDDLTSNG